jgi:small subunit ribosomal protein S1
MSETETLTPAGAQAVEGSDGLLLQIDGQIIPNYDATLVPFSEGDVVTGKVVRIDKDEVLVDIGYKSEGVIPSNELSIRKSANPEDEVELGEEVDALVLTKEDQDGRLIMSKKRARFEKAWRRIEAAAESGEPVEGSVIEVVKGGLIIDLGVRGFLPASLVDIRRVQNLDEFLGTMIECKVIELNRSRNNVVLSRRAVLEEERKEVRQQILDRLQPGQVVEGAISNIVDFGAFVDLDGIDGLIHISELSWSHVNHPSEILSIGDVVPVKVLDIDRDRQRISLGLKQTQEDPWQRVVDTYNLGDELEGKVTKVVSFGAFVEILDGVEGLVHISELANHHVENPREVVNQGDVIRVKILEIDSERRRLSLSAKRVEDQVLPIGGPRPISDEPLEGEVRDLGLSEDVFADAPAADPEPPRDPALSSSTPGPEIDLSALQNAQVTEPEPEPPAEVEEAPAEEAPAEEAPADEAPAEEPVAEAPAPEVEAEAPAAEPEAEAPAAEAPAAEAEAEAPADAETTAEADEPAEAPAEEPEGEDAPPA